jgi:uncharacterized protein YjbJ (UPF0337 family)
MKSQCCRQCWTRFIFGPQIAPPVAVFEKEPAMKDNTKDQAQGKAHELKGAVKEKIGRAIDDPNLEDEGTVEKVAGKIQKKVGQVEKVFEK